MPPLVVWAVKGHDWAGPLDSRASKDRLFRAGPPQLRIDQGRTWPLRMEHQAASEDGGLCRPREGPGGLSVGMVCWRGDRRPLSTPAHECINENEPREEE